MPAARHTSPTQGLSLSPILAAFHRIPRNLANRKKKKRNRVGRSVAGVSKGRSVRNMAAEALGTPAARLTLCFIYREFVIAVNGDSGSCGMWASSFSKLQAIKHYRAAEKIGR